MPKVGVQPVFQATRSPPLENNISMGNLLAITVYTKRHLIKDIVEVARAVLVPKLH